MGDAPTELRMLKASHLDAHKEIGRLEELNRGLVKDYNTLLIELSRQQTRAETAEAEKDKAIEDRQQLESQLRANFHHYAAKNEQLRAERDKLREALERIANQGQGAVDAYYRKPRVPDDGRSGIAGTLGCARRIARDALATTPAHIDDE